MTPTPPHPIPPALRSSPSRLFVETTTRCNLSCVMCVKQADGCGIHEGDLAPATFAALEPVLPAVESLILNGIGEPLLHPQLEDFIARARALMPPGGRIGFQSNGLLLDDGRALALLAAGLDRLCLSLESVDPQIFMRIREGGRLSAVEQALAALGRARTVLGRDDFQSGVEFVLMPNNREELPQVVRWAAARGASFVIVTHALPYGAAGSTETTYETCSGAAVELFREWQTRAAAAGIPFARYPRVVWKFTKSAEELQVVRCVEELKAEAERRGLVLDLPKLFALDHGRLARTAELFAEARQVAAACGIDLQLPELFLKEERRCDFVEEGGMFVSWDGEVFPCYFLWHRYLCYASGWRQTVRGTSFGSLAGGDDPLTIWNSPAFRVFRANVIAYDYPYCASCSLAPCDYVQTEQFEQDCHINAEPCGSCLWCMGIFQCLR